MYGDIFFNRGKNKNRPNTNTIIRQLRIETIQDKIAEVHLRCFGCLPNDKVKKYPEGL